uniref:Expressed protein n=2 Tax=Oryza sativa subsp. japonica TaxID=39947 RepID=B7F0V1_ORYSJ|nr:expressed protein [Oryza sativa Japonica Group]BAG98248.1 unnamed protein product [Oryza sativa Japonica Group]
MHTPSMDQPAASNGDEAPRMEMCPSLYRAARSGRAEEVMALLLQQRPGDGAAAHRQVAEGCQEDGASVREESDDSWEEEQQGPRGGRGPPMPVAGGGEMAPWFALARG